MKLTKECLIRNKIEFDLEERKALIAAYNIVEAVIIESRHSTHAADEYIIRKCTDILGGISELLDNYSNEYLDK